MRERIISLMIVILVSLMWISYAYSLTEDTHKAINENIANREINNFSLNEYLINNLGLKTGVKESLYGYSEIYKQYINQRIENWLGEGGILEDRPGSITDYITGKPSRSVNHFHNPLKTNWDEAGLNDTFLGKSYTGQSSVLWAQNTNQNIGGKWSWKDAREYFYIALTGKDFTGNNVTPLPGETEEEKRERYFTNTFRGIGQQMHLVEDASVPAHVRNDIHIPNPLYPHYEQKVEAFRTKQNIYGTFWNDLLANPITFDKSILNIASTHPSAPVPISRIIDTDLYNEDNPNVTTTLYNSPQYIGVAEYTNANFMSKDTLFTHLDFNYPNISDTVLWIDNNNREYVKKVGSGDTINHLAITSWLYPFRITYFPQYTEYLPVGLDEECYKEYAQKLIPRAVGYSAGLLDYFFRGDLDLIEDTVTGSGYVIVNNTEEDMNGAFEIYYDDINDMRKLFWTGTFALGTLSSGNNESTNITFTPPSDAKEEGKYILVFKGRLGNEDNAVAGKVINNAIYLIVIPVDPSTREMLGKQFYSRSSNTLNPITETDLPFEIVDDGGYWDTATSSWTAKAHPESLGAPLSTGGPQYIAKYWDEANQRVRFVSNLSYEKEAYHAFNRIYKNLSNEVIKDFYNVIFNGSRLNFGAYQENAGYMEYTEDTNNPGTFGLYSLRPKLASNPLEIFFSLYKSLNFNDTFLEYDTSKFYYFNGTVDAQTIPKDIDAPYSSVVAVSKTGGTFNIKIPKIFNYTRPNPYWPGFTDYGSSGIDNYIASIGTPMSYSTTQNKCISEDSNCGNIYRVEEGSSNTATLDIPYNYQSYVRVHISPYYEELYINGQPVESSPIATDGLRTHYQILAVYKDIAVIRETNYVSYSETPLDYKYVYRIYDGQWNFTATYYIYIKGVKYNLTGTTNITSRYLETPYAEIPEAGTTSPVNYLTFEPVEDIIGYHIDRIFISDSFDGSNILVAFDEYAYNNGAGLVHDLKYELSDEPLDQGEPEKHILYYSIPLNEIQAVDHGGTRVGRKLLLFNADGTLKESLQDPVGLSYTIGSIGILN